MLQAILNDLELQLSYCTDDFTAGELTDKELCDTIVHYLIHAFLQVFLLHRVGVEEMEKIAEYIYLCATDFEDKADEIRAGVNAICEKFPLYK